MVSDMVSDEVLELLSSVRAAMVDIETIDDLTRERDQLRDELVKAHKLNNLIAPLEARVDELIEARLKFAGIVARKEWALQAALTHITELAAHVAKLEKGQQ